MPPVDPIYPPPLLDEHERGVVAAIEDLRERMHGSLAVPRRWVGGLRRVQFARGVRASNSIEGIHASLDDVVDAVDGREPLEAGEETAAALLGYRQAMTYVLQMAADPAARVDDGIIRSLHFMMLGHELDKSPGAWRRGPIWVRDGASGAEVYEGPPATDVPRLVDALVLALADDGSPPMVAGAMAHLNLVMIHPFRDGNGRMARCLQTLVLARRSVVSPVFSIIEEYLGRNTRAYYDVLSEVGRGRWNPGADSRPWVRFCLTAHYRQAHTHLRRIRATEQLWVRCEELAREHRLPERAVPGLMDAARGMRLRNAAYRAAVATGDGGEINELMASRDLRAMVGSGLLVAHGERRGRRYSASPRLRDVAAEVHAARPVRSDVDPFAVSPDQLVRDVGR